MATNFPGPYSLRFFYTTTPTGFQPYTHKLELNCDVVGDPVSGDPFGDIELQRRGGTIINAQTAAIAFINLLQPHFSNNTDFTLVELWNYEEESFDARFVSAFSPALVGTGPAPSAATAAIQTILTFRSTEGGIAKFALMEGGLAPGPRQSFPTANVPINNLMTYVASPTTWVLARDTSHVVVPLNCLPGQNEAMFKRRFRP
jgi:hypothetical protein